MLQENFLLACIVVFLAFFRLCLALGMSVPPVQVGDRRRYSSLDNLLNCVGYSTMKDDIIIVRVKSGDRQISQLLNLHVFDSEGNQLRTLHDTAGEQMFMFTNLNNPTQLNDESPEKLINRKDTGNSYSDLLSPNQGKSYVYICFDNIYTDKSWSFQKQHRDVSFQILIRNMTTLKETNYNTLAKHFNLKNLDEVDLNNNDEFVMDFTETDFENAMNSLHSELQHVLNELKLAENNINTLVDHQKLLRNANETIFESYTKSWLLLIICICAFSVIQLIYYKCYLTRRKII